MDNAGTERTVVHIVDDDDAMRTALRRILEASGYDVRSYASAGDFLVAETVDAPGCLLLDVKMPGPSGLDLQDALARRGEPLPVVFLTGHGSIPMSVRAVKAGASNFLTKPVERETLLAALESALEEDAANRTERTKLRALRKRYETLTPRERDVFDLVIAGRLNKQIAADIGVAERTVKAHRAQVMEKMAVDSLADLVRAASRLGLPKP